MAETMAWVTLLLSALPVTMALSNAPFFRRLRPSRASSSVQNESNVSVLIPVRNEAPRIGPTLRAVLASEGLTFEVLVLDDGSTDDTATIVQQFQQVDGRVRLLRGGSLPHGWSGKQYACHQLAQAARYDILIWLDADVEISAQALHRAGHALMQSNTHLLSGFPLQRTASWSERLVVPMIHVLLLGYLPMWGMRWFRHPGFAAGCGQFFVADRSAYEAVGGHASIKRSFHDGLTLPRAFRKAGFHTDIFDATDLACCRMYAGLTGLWQGFAKNAHEGMAGSIALPIWTVLLFGGHVLPWLFLAVAFVPFGAALPWVPVVSSCVLAAGYALGLGWRYRHPFLGIVGRPVGVILLLAIQWHALIRLWRGQPMRWRGRTQPGDAADPDQLTAHSSLSGDRP